MDSLTQIVLGAAVAEVIAGKKLGNRAILYGGILGTIPDLDVVVGKFYDIVTANDIHRGFSHSIVFFLLASPLLAFVLKKLEARNAFTFREGFLMSFWCLFTHALLDAFTNWGTQLFWPLPTRISIQSVFVVDPLYTLPFLFCVIMAMRFKRNNPVRGRWNRLGLVLSSSYLLLTLIIQTYARHRFREALNMQGIEYSQLSVRPAPLNAILWNANVEVDRGYLLGEYSVFDTSPIAFRYFPQNKALLGTRIDSPIARQLIRMSDGWYSISESGGKLYFNDMRFGLISEESQQPEFVFRYEIENSAAGMTAHEADSPARREPGKLLGRLWKRMWGK